MRGENIHKIWRFATLSIDDIRPFVGHGIAFQFVAVALTFIIHPEAPFYFKLIGFLPTGKSHSLS